MQILVIGGGGREHALVWKLAQSKHVKKIYAAPGNPGIEQLAICVNIDINNPEEIANFAQSKKIDLTVVGPEGSLVQGVADIFEQRGLLLFGPNKAAARIEGSKIFAKELMKKYNIPSAKYESFQDATAAKEYIQQQGVPIVIKADGLAAGKGVVVALTMSEALDAVDKMLVNSEFGSAGSTIVVEEYLDGEEVSLLAFTDGKTISPMVAAQDHKRINDNDQGPNTGGMGTYAPAPILTPDLRQEAICQVLEPVIKAMNLEGCPYKGCLYAGLILTKQGIKVIEFNARFGDPETQVVLPLLETDLVNILLACVNGTLDNIKVRWSTNAAVCVVMSAQGYPASEYRKGDIISGLEHIVEMDNVEVFHAGTGTNTQSDIITKGGRVLGVVGFDKTLQTAKELAYKGVEQIHFEGMHYRKDIAWRALGK